MASLAGLRARFGSLFDLRKLKFAVLAGAATATNIAVTGLQTTDVLLACFEVVPPATASGNLILADRVAAATVSITSAGNIQVSGTSAAGNQLLLVWFDETL